MEARLREIDREVKEHTCLFAGLRPQERRTVCLPITVPFSFCNASSALFLQKCSEWHRVVIAPSKIFRKMLSVNLQITPGYLFANCTNPHPFPTGILTETISPYWENGCLRSSSVTLGSSPPTNIYNVQQVSHKTLMTITTTATIKPYPTRWSWLHQ